MARKAALRATIASSAVMRAAAERLDEPLIVRRIHLGVTKDL